MVNVQTMPQLQGAVGREEQISNRVVFKYKIVSDGRWHEVPNGHVTLVAMHGGYLHIWVEQNPLD